MTSQAHHSLDESTLLRIRNERLALRVKRLWRWLALSTGGGIVTIIAMMAVTVTAVAEFQSRSSENEQSLNETKALRLKNDQLRDEHQMAMIEYGKKVEKMEEEMSGLKDHIGDLRKVIEFTQPLTPPAPSADVIGADLAGLDRLCNRETNFEACAQYGLALLKTEILAERCENGDDIACEREKQFSELPPARQINARQSTALQWFLRGCNEIGSRDDVFVRSAQACEEAANIYRHSKVGSVRDDRKAAVYYNRACVMGTAHACFQLGVMYKSDSSVTGNSNEVGNSDVTANALFLASCFGGYGNGCHYLAYYYRNNWPLRRHIESAGCRLGSDDSCAHLRAIDPDP